ncbi:MAG: 5-oxoprolinase subunit PxpB [Sphingobacteriia bacterium]|nr:MAG: 5-oxoprolinase subunit PxpB [Sphingobacteriia bacterium]
MNVSNLDIYPLGDQAITIQLGDYINASTNQEVIQIFTHLQNHPINGITDIIPAYSSITIVYDLAQFSIPSFYSSRFDWIKSRLLQELELINPVQHSNKSIKIPVCYNNEFGLDLLYLSVHTNLSIEEIIERHTNKIYTVYMIGFLPGFPYMASVDPGIQMNRRAVPRQIVPKGSVGIAGEQTGIYPLDSPGGWQLIGQTPLNLFDVIKEIPCLLSPGDSVEFYAIKEKEFWEIKKAVNE